MLVDYDIDVFLKHNVNADIVEQLRTIPNSYVHKHVFDNERNRFSLHLYDILEHNEKDLSSNCYCIDIDILATDKEYYKVYDD